MTLMVPGLAVLAEAVQALDRGLDGPARAALASRTKARASEAALRVTREAILLHGAIGFTDDCDVGLYLKRALTVAAWLGNAPAHRRRYAGPLGPADPPRNRNSIN